MVTQNWPSFQNMHPIYPGVCKKKKKKKKWGGGGGGEEAEESEKSPSHNVTYGLQFSVEEVK